MPLQNGTQKKKVLVPDFRRDDGRIDFKLPPKGNKRLQPLVLFLLGMLQPLVAEGGKNRANLNELKRSRFSGFCNFVQDYGNGLNTLNTRHAVAKRHPEKEGAGSRLSSG